MLPNVGLFGVVTPTYVIFMSALACLVIVGVHRKFRTDPTEHRIAMNLAILVLFFGWIGARALHVFWETPYIYKQRPWLILQFWEGGFVFYGGVFLASLAAFIYLKFAKQSFAIWADNVTPFINLGYGFGRLGCFISGCCFGKECPWPWAIHGLHPTQLYAFFWELGVFYFLRSRLKKTPKAFAKPGVFFGVYIVFHAVGRIIMETYRDDFRGVLYSGYSISEVISIGLILFALVWIPVRLVRKPRLPLGVN